MRRRAVYELGIASTLAAASLLAWPLARGAGAPSLPLGWVGPALFLLVWRGSVALLDVALRAVLPPPREAKVEGRAPPRENRWPRRRKRSWTR